MRLLIISNMAHYIEDGRIVGWGPTVQEIDRLAEIFGEIRHIACLHPDRAPASSLPYRSGKVCLIPVPPAGGDGLRDKWEVLRRYPLYAREIMKELPRADVVHVRCPANIGMLAVVMLTASRCPRARWVKYAGNWRPEGREALSYTLQRWWLHRNWHRGKVTLNGRWPDQKAHEHSFPNPSLSQAEVNVWAQAARQKQLIPPYRCAFVGRMEEAKGPHILVEAVRRLRGQRIAVEADLVGDGPLTGPLQAANEDLVRAGAVRLHGWLPRERVHEVLEGAHFVVLPTVASEGWPKVLSEGMAHGAVPIATALSAIPHYLTSRHSGWLMDSPSMEALTEGIAWFLAEPERWIRCRDSVLEIVHQFTFEHYLDLVTEMMGLPKR